MVLQLFFLTKQMIFFSQDNRVAILKSDVSLLFTKKKAAI